MFTVRFPATRRQFIYFFTIALYEVPIDIILVAASFELFAAAYLRIDAASLNNRKETSESDISLTRRHIPQEWNNRNYRFVFNILYVNVSPLTVVFGQTHVPSDVTRRCIACKNKTSFLRGKFVITKSTHEGCRLPSSKLIQPSFISYSCRASKGARRSIDAMKSNNVDGSDGGTLHGTLFTFSGRNAENFR
jgi:hypothetical protein